MVDATIQIPVDLLNSLLDMAESHVDDIESGIAEGIYSADDNPDIERKRRDVNQIRAMLSA